MLQVVIHGHFYQPPREDPWLELVPREASAAPDHDWNERITRQCYQPLSQATVLDDAGRIRRIINAWSWCSFDIGPTLHRWFDQHAPQLLAAILAGDRESNQRVGCGNAMAMPYHHVILPLLSHRDRVTEVRWGIREFRSRFGREPEGMWLPEAAVDDDTLAVLADEQIRFTVLGPSQVNPAPPHGMPGRWRGAGGRELAIFVYDGAASHHVAFGDALQHPAQWEESLLSRAVNDADAVVSIATDGETFGHHHRHGVTGLAALIDRLQRRGDVTVTNYAAILRRQAPVMDLAINSPSSWSCPHGIERWRTECGCRFDPATQQSWRAPLHQAIGGLTAAATEVIQRSWPATAGDYFTARDVAGADLAGAPQLPVDARRLLELSQQLLAMHTSCAWFFDDIGRLEPRIVLRHAARALDLLPPGERLRLEPGFVATLARAVSNDPRKGSGADIWARDIVPDSHAIERLAAAIAAVREFVPAALDDIKLPAHTWTLEGDDIVIRHRRTGMNSRWRAEPVVFGVIAARTHVRSLSDGTSAVVLASEFPAPFRAVLTAAATTLVFDAALGTDRNARDESDLRPAAARGAWKLIQRDGAEQAGVVMHAVLDLYDLDAESPPESLRIEALEHLASVPRSHWRDALADRLGIVLDGDTPPPDGLWARSAALRRLDLA